MKFSKQLALLVLSLVSTSVFAAKATLLDYSAIMTALRAGNTVHAVIDVDKCHYANNGRNQWEEKTRGFRIEDIYERSAPDIATGKKMHMVAASVHDYVGNVRDGAYISRSLLRIFENGNVEVIDQMFSMETTKFTDESVLLCHMSADGSGGVTITSKFPKGV